MDNPFTVLEQRLINIETLLETLHQKQQIHDTRFEEEEILTVQETAKFLNLAVPTIYTLNSQGKLPSMKLSKRCYFSKRDLLQYLKEGRKRTNSELEEIAQKHLTKGRK